MRARDRRVTDDQTQAGAEATGEVGAATGTHAHRLIHSLGTVSLAVLFPGTPLPNTSVSKKFLLCLLSVSRRIGAYPQQDMGWLHRLPYHP